MKRTLVTVLAGSAIALLATQAMAKDWPEPIVRSGPYQPTMDSLKQYQCPDWFRNAKFGIWAHWGPQAVPMDGDWYARGMYEPGNGHYAHHLANYGHPSTNGYKDIIPLWKAEKWDPERLMALYKKAGARYFVSMGTHHDNFELWNDPLHRWNAVNMGPKRDVVGEWQKAAQKNGLRFGVSEHLGASFTWFQSAHRADKQGPMAGVPYDGQDPQYWDLYHQPATPGDTGWYSTNSVWHNEWYARIKTLIDGYNLDLLYTDGGVPFGNQAGRSMIAHLYNTDLANRSTQQVVYCCKEVSGGRWIEDLERGVMPRINPDPWQTDTSIGDWFYNKNWKFRPVSWVITMLADIVAKNGNLLLNVVQRPDGSLDPEVEQMLEQIAAWNAVNGEAIFDTRPWLVYGEGAVRYKAKSFAEDFKYSASDVRFTTKGNMLYAIVLGWPENGQITIRTLAQAAGEKVNVIKSIRMLGAQGDLTFSQDTNGLTVKFPAQKPCDVAYTLAITGTDLKAVDVPMPSVVVKADSKGNFKLSPDDADLDGGLKSEQKGNESNLGFWDNGSDSASWKISFPAAGAYKVSTSAASTQDSEFVVELADQHLTGKVVSTGNYETFKAIDLGKIEIKKAGEVTLKVRAADASKWKPINLRTIKLEKAE